MGIRVYSRQISNIIQTCKGYVKIVKEKATALTMSYKSRLGHWQVEVVKVFLQKRCAPRVAQGLERIDGRAVF